MKRLTLFVGILLAALSPLACQKTYTLGPLNATAGTPTPNPTATPIVTPNATCPVGNHPFLAQWGNGVGTGNGQFNSMGNTPSELVLDSAGNLYVCDYKRVEVFSPSGTFLSQWTSGAGGSVIYPWSIAIDPAGNLYVLDATQQFLNKFTSAGVYVNQTATCQGSMVALDNTGNLYVTCLSSCIVQVFNSSMVYQTSWGSCGFGNGQLNNPLGIAIDAGGNVYVADNLNDRVEKFTTNGTYLSQWGNSGSGNGQFNHPFKVALSDCGNVFVSDYDNDRIQEFDPNGTYLSQWGSVGTGNNQFTPHGLVIDTSRNIYVADDFNHLIKEYGP